MKFQDDISFRTIIVAKVQGPKFRKRAITKKYQMIFFQFFIKYSIHHSLSADTSFKFLALILFEKHHLQNFIPLYVKRAVILQGEIIHGKPKLRVSNFSTRNPYMKFQDDNLDAPNIHTYIHTYGQSETKMLPLFQSWA